MVLGGLWKSGAKNEPWKKTVPTQQILSGKSVEKSEHDMPSAIIILGYKICIK